MRIRLALAACLALPLLAVSGCQPSGTTARLTLTADGKVDRYRMFVWDSDSKQQLLDTSWVTLTKPDSTIGLKLPKEGKYTLVIFGAEGTLVKDGQGNDVPAPGSELFFATRFTGKGSVEVAARLVHVPGGTNGKPDDDQDRDLWPSMSFPMDVGGETQSFYADKMDLLDCDDLHSDAHPFGTEKCTTPMIDEDCDGATPACLDSDGDGDPDDTDCKPMDPKIHHPTVADPFPESPNCCGRNLGKGGTEASMVFGEPLCHNTTCGDGIDQDCSGQDTKCEHDNDCDGALAATTMQAGADGGAACNAPANDPPGNDCNDCDATVNPNAPEICDGIDNNCNGLTDETCVTCDLDGDGFQRMDSANGCPDAAYVATGKMIDCNDDDAGVFPGLTTYVRMPLRAPLQAQTCKGKEGGSVACALRQACKRRGADGNLQDMDCNGMAAEGCPSAMCDADGDGFIDSTKKTTCDPGGLAGPYDCNDADATVFPAAPDKCGDAIAQNCGTDTVCGTDNDKDGYDTTTDCDDTDPNVHPWATEICDGKDNDCDGLIDEGNPDITGAPMYDATTMTVMHCNDSNVGECNKKTTANTLTGRCVCSPSTLMGLFFTQGDRVACPVGMPTETQAVDDSSASAPRCYGAYQPLPQTCSPTTPKDDDCDGRDDAPDGKNLALLGSDCWPTAKGECKKGSGTNSGAKVIGCDKSKVNCFAAFPVSPAVNPWLMCDNAPSCPVAEKCNGLDDDCNAAIPTNEADQDNDGYMACWNGTSTAGCDLPLKPGLLGCGDCQDVAMGAIHPNAAELCNNVDDDCNVACDTTTHQCNAMVSADGSGQCGAGAFAALPDCCSNQSACRDLKTDFMSCGSCTAGHVTNCNPLFSNVCVPVNNAGACSCGQTMNAPCGTHTWCNGGGCMNCGDDAHCGNSCVTCTSTLTPKCKSDQTGCVECNVDVDCSGQKTCGSSGCWCKSNICTIKTVLGIACGGDNECGSGNCVDAVCCNQPLSSCNGCRQCNLGTSLGTCTSVPNGNDPHTVCTLSVGNCKQDNCDGAGTCNAVNTTACGLPSCVANAGTATQTDPTCGVSAGNGVCGMPTKSCGNYLCASNVCGTSCTSDSDCSNGNYCNAAGLCVTQKVQGNACNLAAGSDCRVASCRACNTGNCVDGFCCNTGCGGSCDVCSLGLGATANGTCTILPLGSVGSPTCSPFTCTGASASCPSVCASDSQCIGSSYCDAASACTPRKAQGSVCNLAAGNDCKVNGCRACGTAGSCQDGFCCDTLCNSTFCVSCTAAKSTGINGTCSPVDANTDPDAECANGLTCSGASSCRVNCTSDAQCEAGYYCSNTANGACILKKNLGNACASDPIDGTGNHQCTSTHCADGVCCNVAAASCTGCMQCNLGTSLGTCANVPSGSDPHGVCGTNAATCTLGGCNGSNACTPATNGTTCVTAVCSNTGASCPGTNQCTASTLTTRTCNGSVVGSCPAAVMNACANNRICNTASTCKVSCTIDNDCLLNFYCASNNCTSRLADGAVCGANNQCLSNKCFQAQAGFRCAKAAVVSCPTCQVTNASGDCTPTTVDTDPRGDCPADSTLCQSGSCDGASACKPSPNGTVCNNSVCGSTGNAFTPTRACNGTVIGSCPAASTNPCTGDYNCASASACRVSCTIQNDCRNSGATFCCQSNLCKDKTQAASCGNSCTDCTAGTNNTACIGGSACGCSSGANCDGSSCCNGSNTCVARNLATSCGPSCLNCTSSSSNTKCISSASCGCNADTDCIIASEYCSGVGGTCQTRKTAGGTCPNGNECASGTTCSNANSSQGATKRCANNGILPCATCNVVNAAGTACTAADAGTDPNASCNGSCYAGTGCNGSGGCNALASGTACGGNYVCQGGTDIACPGACTPRGTGSGTCGGSFCCNGSSCVTEAGNTACGPSCLNCTTANLYDKICRSSTACGCDVNTDCDAGTVARSKCETVNHRCGECNASGDCSGGKVCDKTAVPSVCVECLSSPDCATNNKGHVCTGNVCGCGSNADCPNGIAPFCGGGGVCGCGVAGTVCSLATQRCTTFDNTGVCKLAPAGVCGVDDSLCATSQGGACSATACKLMNTGDPCVTLADCKAGSISCGVTGCL